MVNEVLNVFFLVFHSAWTLFNCIGWIFPRTRKWNLITLIITGCSWFILGIWYGWGYCWCTDMHWEVRKEMGVADPEHSYIAFLIRLVTGLKLPSGIVDTMTAVVFFSCLFLSLFLFIRDRKKQTA